MITHMRFILYKNARMKETKIPPELVSYRVELNTLLLQTSDTILVQRTSIMTRPARLKLRAMFILGVVSSAVLAAPTSVGPSLSFEARSTEAQAFQPPTGQGSGLEVPSGDGLPGGLAFNALGARGVESANVEVPRQDSVVYPGDHLKGSLNNIEPQSFRLPDTGPTPYGGYTLKAAVNAAGPRFEQSVWKHLMMEGKKDEHLHANGPATSTAQSSRKSEDGGNGSQ
ncbi:hypothetical protein FB446DRAFT_740063 [Lentinula raphanica]|nr:hypothetical protein FB446DRAFT_740063 [Lentinula raphanica]